MDFSKLITRYRQLGGRRLIWQYARLGALWPAVKAAWRFTVKGSWFKIGVFQCCKGLYGEVIKHIEPFLVEKCGIDMAQDECFMQGEVRSWMNGNTQVFLPAANQDVIFVFTHILHHFFIEGVGLRQVCDWCRLLFCYREKLDLRLLEARIRRMGLISEWKTFAALAVNTLRMPREAMPLYDSNPKWSKKAEKVLDFIMETGNFGHNRRDDSSVKKSFIGRKFSSLWLHTKDNIRQIAIFPMDSIRVWWGMVTTGLYETVRGK